MDAITSYSKLLKFSLIFGLLGALLGFILRYAFAEVLPNFPFKNVLHSHSHIMLLGFIFNALVILIWKNFTKSIDKKSRYIFYSIQACVFAMAIAFIYQGYALFSIFFSTAHLILSFVFLLRLWKQLSEKNSLTFLIKIGIFFHFFSTLGPFALGPLMVLDLKDTIWYQQAIFFYLHFQYFGSMFFWLIAIFLKKNKIDVSKKQITLLTTGMILLYAHSFSYSVQHISTHILGFVGASCFLFFLISIRRQLKNNFYFSIFFLLCSIAVLSLLGSFPALSLQVSSDRNLLIGWLHFIFLGLYTPFIWRHTTKVKPWFWYLYILVFLCSEFCLIFPSFAYNLTKTAITNLLLISYFGVFICFCIVHLPTIFKVEKNDTSTTR